MGETAFEIGVAIKALDYFSGPIGKMMSSAEAAQGKLMGINSMMKTIGKSSAEIDAVTSALHRLNDQKAFGNIAGDLQKIGMAKDDIAAMETSYMRMAQYSRDMAKAQETYAGGQALVASGTHDLGVAAVGGFGIYEMVKQAGEFQSNMATIQDSTGATSKQMDDFGNAIMNASQKVSKFNDFQMAKIAQTLTSGGFSNVKQAQDLLLPTAKFAEVQAYENKASDPVESTKQAIEMAHVFKNYDPKSFGNFLDTFNKYSMMQPGASSQLEQTLTYLAPTAQTLGMKPNDIMALAALDNRIGLTGSHGGTNSADMILRMIPGLTGGAPTPIKDKKGHITGYKTPQAWAAMQDLGLIDSKGNSKFFNKDGSIKDFHSLLSTLISDAKGKKPDELMRDYNKIFGIQGGRAASILSDPKVLEQLQGMDGQLTKTKNIDKIHDDHMNTSAGQLNLFKSNGMTLMLRVGNQLAKSLNPALKTINDMLDKLGKFSQAHPGINKIIGDFILFAVGGKAAQGVIKILAGNFKMLGGILKMVGIKGAAGEITFLGRSVLNLKSMFSMAQIGVKMFTSNGLKNLGSVVKSTGTIMKSMGTAGKEAFKIFGGGTLSAIKLAGNVLKDFGKGSLKVIGILGKFGLEIIKLGVRFGIWAVQVAADWLIAMGPVGWIILGVTAIIAAAVLAWNTNFMGFRDKLTAVWKVVQKDAGKAWDWIKTKAKEFMDFLKNLPKEAETIGKNIIDGLKNGLMGAVGGLKSAVQGIGSSISSTFKSILGIHSPSKVFAEHGKWIVAGLSQGIEGNAKLANRSAENLANQVDNSFNPNPSIRGGGLQTSQTGGTINIHPGAIVIQGGNDSAEVIANKVLDMLGRMTRRSNLNSGVSLNMGAI